MMSKNCPKSGQFEHANGVKKIAQKVANLSMQNGVKNLPLFCHFKYAKIVSWDE